MLYASCKWLREKKGYYTNVIIGTPTKWVSSGWNDFDQKST